MTLPIPHRTATHIRPCSRCFTRGVHSLSPHEALLGSKAYHPRSTGPRRGKGHVVGSRSHSWCAVAPETTRTSVYPAASGTVAAGALSDSTKFQFICWTLELSRGFSSHRAWIPLNLTPVIHLRQEPCDFPNYLVHDLS